MVAIVLDQRDVVALDQLQKLSASEVFDRAYDEAILLARFDDNRRDFRSGQSDERFESPLAADEARTLLCYAASCAKWSDDGHLTLTKSKLFPDHVQPVRS